MNEWKGWDVFIEAARLTHQRLPEAVFRLVGGVVPGADIDAAAVEKAVGQADPSRTWLRWLGEQPSALPSMRHAWLVAVPSIRPDPFPNVVLEGMTQARAIVGSNLGGIPEMVMDGETGKLVPAGDAASLAEAMTSVLSDRQTATRLGAAGRRRVQEEFSTARFDASWRAILASELRLAHS
jgi:glycosyltransferase involved in cell wall biosynthesis